MPRTFLVGGNWKMNPVDKATVDKILDGINGVPVPNGTGTFCPLLSPS